MNRIILFLGLAIAAVSAAHAEDRRYEGARRFSEYLTMSDGTKVAYDLFLPVTRGVVADTPLPALFKYTPYGRAWTVFDKNGKNNLTRLVDMPWYGDIALRVRRVLAGNLMDALSRTRWLNDMVKAGYAVLVADRPGTGASSGKLSYSPDAGGREACEIIDWIAAQKWSNGNVGMFGDSIQAQIQFQAAAVGNPHLKAILPATTWMDNYSAVIFPGGIPDSAFARMYERLNNAFDTLATPVDSDPEGVLLARARAERGNGSSLSEAAQAIGAYPFRDTLLPDGRNLWIDLESLYPLLDRINRSGTAVYLIDGWYDIYARDDFLIYRNLTVPKRLLVRPTDHNGIEAPGSDIDYALEARRWFDYWLKGIDNGIVKEPPIRYNLQAAGKSGMLLTSKSWPPEGSAPVAYYFGAGDANGSQPISRGMGVLGTSRSSTPDASDSYTVDYSTTTGKKPHWTALASSHEYTDMSSHDSKGLTYTTAPLQSSLDVVGHPVVRVWLSTTAQDLDLFAYLEAVDANGRSTYITQGNLRASHRKLSPAPFDNLGLPWHDHFRRDLEPIPSGTAFELVFDLLPTAYELQQGQRLRISIACADSGNFDTPAITPPPTLRLFRDAEHPSCVLVPVLRGR